jgi:hypothetical protein
MTRNNSLIVPLTPEDSAITLALFSRNNASVHNITAEDKDNEARLVAYLVEHADETKAFTESEADLDTPDDPFFDDPDYAEFLDEVEEQRKDREKNECKNGLHNWHHYYNFDRCAVCGETISR